MPTVSGGSLLRWEGFPFLFFPSSFWVVRGFGFTVYFFFFLLLPRGRQRGFAGELERSFGGCIKRFTFYNLGKSFLCAMQFSKRMDKKVFTIQNKKGVSALIS